jgi:hypothetical protein
LRYPSDHTDVPAEAGENNCFVVSDDERPLILGCDGHLRTGKTDRKAKIGATCQDLAAEAMNELSWGELTRRSVAHAQSHVRPR